MPTHCFPKSHLLSGDRIAQTFVRWVSLLLIPACLLHFGATAFAADPSTKEAKKTEEAKVEWKPLFDGKTLGDWKVTKFGGEGKVEIKKGELHLNIGNPLTGVTWKKEFPKTNYEISLKAKRVDGSDFFCGLTVPVEKSYCSLILGGWGGTVVGISSLDGNDASENETTKYIAFKKDQWYHIRMRVVKDRIQAWLDDKMIVNVNTKKREISTRIEVDLSQPLGICSFQTLAGIKDIQYRTVDKPAPGKVADFD